MIARLESPHWFRVAALKPRLSPDAALTRQRARGRVWHLLTDGAGGRQVRLNAAAWAFAGRCDGARSADAIWQDLLREQGEACPSQDDALRVLARLNGAGLLRFDGTPDLDALFEARREATRRRDRARTNPLALRVRLFDPSRLVERLWPHARALFSTPALLLMALLVAGTALACLVHADAIVAAIVRAQSAPRTLALVWLVFPVVKAIHELAHALALRRYGGRIRHAGLTLMLLTPAPWVDASAASTLADRRARIAVSAAGILAELVVAALAALTWLAVEPGVVSDLALVTLSICGLSTLAINANPLMRLDGYHIATDLLGLPNLAVRSAAWWQQTLLRLLHGRAAVPSVELPAGETRWLALYAPAAFLYRLALLGTFVLWLGHLHAAAGAAAAILLVAWLVGTPFMAWLRAWRHAPSAAARARAGRAGAGLAFALLLVFVAVPLPDSVVAQGVVWPPDDAQVRAGSGGFVQSLDARHGDDVEPGAPLATLAEDGLAAELARAQSVVEGLRARQYATLLQAPAEAASVAVEIERAEAEAARARDRMANLSLRSHAPGRLVLPHEADLPGTYASQGAMLGYVITDGPAHVRAVLEENDALRVRRAVRAVEVRLAGREGASLAALWRGDTPAASGMLPSAALGERGGGTLAVDPADREGRRTADPVFNVEVVVPALPAERMGLRAWVRFDLGFETLGERALRRTRQLLLKHFAPSGSL